MLQIQDHPKPKIDDLLLPTHWATWEILDLRWDQVDLKERCIRLKASDTKTDKPRLIVMTDRVFEALRDEPHHIRSPYVFVNPQTGTCFNDIRPKFKRACNAAGIKATGKEGLWFHDLRRSFVTNARLRGVPESVVMRMSGHRTRCVFDRYNIVEEEDLREAVRRIEEGRERETGGEQRQQRKGRRDDT